MTEFPTRAVHVPEITVRESSPTPNAALQPPRAMSPWLSFAIRRGASLIVTFLALVVVSFMIVQLIPGDPAFAIAGANADLADVERVRRELGLDLPLGQQFLTYVGQVLSGDLGTSFIYRQPVATVIMSRLPFTATIAVAGIITVLLISIPLGMVVGLLTRAGRRGWLDTAFGVITGFLDSIPGYVVATLLVIFFALGIGFFPMLPPAYSTRMVAESFVLPVAALVIGPICTVSRVVRRETAVVLENDYMRTARGWRIPASKQYVKWALPNLLTTTLTLSGLIFSGMIGGAIVIESVFALPGLGTGIIKAILDRDYPVIQGMVIVIGMIAATINLLVDVVLGLIDSRNLGGSHANT
ncbi:ABC transporter permease [Arthrobacter sp. StoSoilB5]|uniref:ABC transporter permease n=1 Tax=Arthrobacter sp. StoSoilB5 TaxID=2830992 RepID=UPI001CC50D33|nr:ABC transporter permease [Arthrobacter sp. StoSoilB5]BCW45094.1 peptide ABC transporter permease [Arthrobacter sp. StoSoilB5]